MVEGGGNVGCGLEMWWMERVGGLEVERGGFVEWVGNKGGEVVVGFWVEDGGVMGWEGERVEEYMKM